MRLIHITDPHLSDLRGLTLMGLRGKRRSGYISWYRKRRHFHSTEVLERVTEAVCSHRPDLVLLTGDLIHIGLEREMIEAARWLERLGPPEKVVLIPGNHDNYARDSLAAMFRHWRSYLPEEAGPDGSYTTGYPIVHERESIKLLGVNTSCLTRMFSAAGAVGSVQQRRLSDALEKKAGDERFHCLLIHHPPLPGMTRRRKALRDSAQLERIIDQHPPDLILYGHLHRNSEHRHGATRIFCTESASGIENASYRIFDLEDRASGWQCRMRLVTLENGAGPRPEFRVSAQSCWQSRSS